MAQRHSCSRWAPATIIMAVALVAVACGSSPTDTVDTRSSISPAGDGSGSRSGATSSTTEPPPGSREVADLAGLVRCDDVPELTAEVEGSLDRFANPDDEVVGVLITYGLEHPDTYAGFWIDRNRGGALVLAFTDDPQPHLEAVLGRGPSDDDVETVSPRPPIRDPRPLGERDDVVVDVVRAAFTEAELTAAGDRFWGDPPPYVLSGGVNTTKNRLSVDLIDPTADQLADLAGRVDRAMTCVDVTITPTPPAGALDVIPHGETALTCGDGGGPGFPASALDERVPAEAVDDPAAAALLATIVDPPARAALEDIEQRPPTAGWFVLAIHDATAVFGNGDDPPLMAAFLERAEDGWQFNGWTIRCTPTVPLPPGLGPVQVVLDPGHPRPGPHDTVIHLQVTERACVGGQALGDRLRGPQVEESDRQILIAFAAESLLAPATCPGNPPEAVTVELSRPLGARPIRNGLVHPPAEITFPVDR